MVGALGYDPSRLQQSAAPVYKTEPHASADAVLLMKLARCMGIKPISTARQAVCLVRCLGAQLVRLAGLEPALHGLSNRSLYRLGYRRVGDAPGNDPGPDRLRAGRSAS